MGKRSRLEIVSDILFFIEKRGVAKPTNILYKANLSVPLLNKYISALVKDGIITEVKSKKTLYALTEKGMTFLKLMKKLNAMTQVIEIYSTKRK